MPLSEEELEAVVNGSRESVARARTRSVHPPLSGSKSSGALYGRASASPPAENEEFELLRMRCDASPMRSESVAAIIRKTRPHLPYQGGVAM